MSTRFSSCSLCPLWFAILVLVTTAGAQAQSLRARMLAAEDTRNPEASAIAPLLHGLRSTEPALVVQAVRGLGRFERPEFVVHILPLLSSPRPDVRRETVNALGQALYTAKREEPERPELARVTAALLNRLRMETDAQTRGVVAETVGRLPHRSAAAVAEVEIPLQGVAAAPSQQHPAALGGAMRGFDFLIRGNQKLRTADVLTRERVRAVATLASDPSDADLAVARRDAWLAVLAAGAADLPLIEDGLDDPDAQVRRLAVAAIAAAQATDAAKRPLLLRALADPSFNVRFSAVQAWGRTLQRQDCAPLLRAAEDPNVHVSLVAIDTLGAGCPAGPSPVALLTAFSDALSQAGRAPAAVAWHRPAHAFAALSRISREPAIARLALFAEHPIWQVRMYAARGAAALSAAARLERLVADDNDNVREAAVAGLKQVRGHDADAIYIQALSRRDYQLVMTAAGALEKSPKRDEAIAALRSALARITAEGRDTSIDARTAILARLREFGAAADVPPRPRRTAQAPREPLPESARMALSGGRVIELALLKDEAPYSVERFAQLARRGYYNGLTFHRVVPNFVLQGGSPGANEYSGDGPFMRDEVGLRSNRRGTIGTSTRGRDTGDAQIYLNLLDNPRLDHEFTVFADITRGLEVMDGIVEGDVIERIEILR